jgi:hypothetical protein
MSNSLYSDGDQREIWRNETPNSAYSCRPQALIRAKEDRGLLKYDFSYTEEEQRKLEDAPTTIVSFRNLVS